jgi:hypothetical protein
MWLDLYSPRAIWAHGVWVIQSRIACAEFELSDFVPGSNQPTNATKELYYLETGPRLIWDAAVTGATFGRYIMTGSRQLLPPPCPSALLKPQVLKMKMHLHVFVWIFWIGLDFAAAFPYDLVARQSSFNVFLLIIDPECSQSSVTSVLSTLSEYSTSATSFCSSFLPSYL